MVSLEILKGIGAFLWRYKTLFLIAAVLGIILFQHSQLEKKDTKITQLNQTIGTIKAERDQAKKDYDNAKFLVEAQNEAVEAYLDDAKKLQEKLATLTVEYSIMDETLNRKIRDLSRKKPVPKDCPGVINWLRDRAIEDYGQYNEVRT